MTADSLSTEIQNAFQAMLDQTPASHLLGGSRLQWTKAIKEAMGGLGKRHAFCVSASGYPEADQGEFLYDMIWYKLDSNGFVLKQYMVMECEYLTAPATVVDDDFQKLIQARGDVRVWVSNCINASDISVHLLNCKKQIELFEESREGDQYVFLLFEWTTRTHVLTSFRA